MNTKAKRSAHVVLGLDKEGKARAALVHPNDLETATKAAAGQGLRIGRAEAPQVLKLATQLPDAKVFATGHGLVPLVRKDIYEWLSKGLRFPETKAEPKTKESAEEVTKARAAADGATAPSPKTGGGENGGTAANKEAETALKPDPRLWQQLTVGSMVVAPEGSTKDDGFWPAVVMAVSKDGSKLTIRWRDFPNQPVLVVKRRSVALLLSHG